MAAKKLDPITLQVISGALDTIAAEMGEAVRGGEHYAALFAVGMTLFAITFVINWCADWFLHREPR